MASPIISDDKKRFCALRLASTLFGGLRLEVAPVALLVQLVVWALPVAFILPRTPSLPPLASAGMRAAAFSGIFLLSAFIPIVLTKYAQKEVIPCWYRVDVEVPENASWKDALLLLFPKRRAWFDWSLGILSTAGLMFAACWRLEVDQVSIPLRALACFGICAAQFSITQNRPCPEVAVWAQHFAPQRSLCIVALIPLSGTVFATLVGLLPLLWLSGMLSFIPAVLWALEQFDKALGASHHGGLLHTHLAQLLIAAAAIFAGYFADMYGAVFAVVLCDEPLFLRRRSLPAHVQVVAGAGLGAIVMYADLTRDKPAFGADAFILRALVEGLILAAALSCWFIRLRLHGDRFFFCIRGFLVFLLAFYATVMYKHPDAGADASLDTEAGFLLVVQLCGAIALTRGAADWQLTVASLVALRMFDTCVTTDAGCTLLVRALGARIVVAKCVGLARQLFFAGQLTYASIIFPKLRDYRAFVSIPLWLVTCPLNFVTESPLLPLFTLPVFLPSFPRPKHWHAEKVETDRADSIIYKQLVPSLTAALGRQWRNGSLPESGFLLTRSHERLITIIEILECGHGWLKIQVRGLEMQEPTSCHHVEAQKVDELLKLNSKIWVDENDHAAQSRLREQALEPKRTVALYPQGTVKATTYESTNFQATGLLDNIESLRTVYTVFAHALVHLIVVEYHEQHCYGTGCADAQLDDFRSRITPHFLNLNFGSSPRGTEPTLTRSERSAPTRQAESPDSRQYSDLSTEPPSLLPTKSKFSVKPTSGLPHIGSALTLPPSHYPDMFESFSLEEVPVESINSSRPPGTTLDSSPALSPNVASSPNVALSPNLTVSPNLTTSPQCPSRQTPVPPQGMPPDDIPLYRVGEWCALDVLEQELLEQGKRNVRAPVANPCETGVDDGCFNLLKTSLSDCCQVTDKVKPQTPAHRRSTSEEAIEDLLRDVMYEGTHGTSPPAHDRIVKSAPQVPSTDAKDLPGVIDTKFGASHAFTEKEVDKVLRMAASCFAAGTLEHRRPEELGSSHLLKLFEGTVSMTDLRIKEIVTRAFRASLKVALDLLVVGDSIEDVTLWQLLLDAFFEIACVPVDSREWAEAMRAGRRELFSLQKSEHQLKVFRMTLREDNVQIASLQSEAVRAFWAATNFELRYATNDDEERYSVQAHPTLLRNLIVQAVEYPTYVSEVLRIKI